MFGLGTRELVIVLIIVIILFGSTRLPALAKSLGKVLREFKKGKKEIDKIKDDIEEAIKDKSK